MQMIPLTAQKMKLSIKENLIFCAVSAQTGSSLPCTFLYICDALRNLLVQFKKRKSTHGGMIH